MISNQPTVQSGWVSRGRVLGCGCGLAVDVAVAMAVTATITLAMDFIGFGATIRPCREIKWSHVSGIFLLLFCIMDLILRITLNS